MFRRLVAGGALLLLISCGGSSPTQAPGGQTAAPPADGGGTTPAPVATPAGGQPNAGNLAAIAAALVPPGSTEVSHVDVGNSYSTTATTTQSLTDLQSFYAQAIPAAGLTMSGQFISGNALSVAFTNPDGGVVATTDTGTGETVIIISVGISQ